MSEPKEGQTLDLNFTKQQFIDLWNNKSLKKKDILNILNISEYAMYRCKEYLKLPDRKIGRPTKLK